MRGDGMKQEWNCKDFEPKVRMQTLDNALDKVAKRNKQLRLMRIRLAELADFLGDARIMPPLPKKLQQWLSAEVRKI